MQSNANTTFGLSMEPRGAGVRRAGVPVLNEATSALDQEAQAHVVGAYREVTRGRTTALITHREEMLRGVDRVVGVTPISHATRTSS